MTAEGARSPARIDFIAGMARSGTTWLGRALAKHPDVAVFGESSFFGRLYVPPRADGTYGPAELARVHAIQREQDWATTTGDDSSCLRNSQGEEYAALVDAAFGPLEAPVTPAESFQALARAIASSERKPCVVEKTPHHVHWMRRIALGFPEARFVLLTRDPYGFMRSLKHLDDRIESRWRRALERPWRHPAVCAVAWRAYMLSVERALEQYRDRVLVVDHRELRQRPEALLASVQSFLGLAVHDLAPGTLGQNSSFRRGGKPSLRGQDVFWMNLIAGRVIRRNGYRREPIPFRPLQILASFATLPLCAAYVAARAPRRVPGSLRPYLAAWIGR